MDDTKKSKNVETKVAEALAQVSPAPQKPADIEPVFPLERLRRDCRTLFGISTSTFDGAAFGRTGDFSVKEMRAIINTWKNTRVFPAAKKEDN